MRDDVKEAGRKRVAVTEREPDSRPDCQADGFDTQCNRQDESNTNRDRRRRIACAVSAEDLQCS